MTTSRMLGLISSAVASESEAVSHPAISLGLFGNLSIDPSARIRLFEDARATSRIRLAPAVAVHEPPGYVAGRRVETFATMIQWAEAHLRPGRPSRTEVTDRCRPRRVDGGRVPGHRRDGFRTNARPLGGSRGLSCRKARWCSRSISIIRRKSRRVALHRGLGAVEVLGGGVPAAAVEADLPARSRSRRGDAGGGAGGLLHRLVGSDIANQPVRTGRGGDSAPSKGLRKGAAAGCPAAGAGSRRRAGVCHLGNQRGA